MLAAKFEFHLTHILTYPLTPVLLTICHPDKMMVKTSKVILLSILETKQETAATSSPKQIGACINDSYQMHLYQMIMTRMKWTTQRRALTAWKLLLQMKKVMQVRMRN